MSSRESLTTRDCAAIRAYEYDCTHWGEPATDEGRIAWVRDYRRFRRMKVAIILFFHTAYQKKVKAETAMKLVEIFQQENPDYLATMQGRAMPLDDLRKVASFETELPTEQALDEAYRLRNQWDDMARLTMKPGDYRSTSIGDVVTVDREAFQCARAGWNKVEFSPNQKSSPNNP